MVSVTACNHRPDTKEKIVPALILKTQGEAEKIRGREGADHGGRDGVEAVA